MNTFESRTQINHQPQPSHSQHIRSNSTFMFIIVLKFNVHVMQYRTDFKSARESCTVQIQTVYKAKRDGTSTV